MEIFIILVIFGLITANVAKSKGRDMVGWFFIGILTGFIGLLILLLLEPVNKKN